MTAASAGASLSAADVARAPLLLVVSVLWMFGLVAIEPEGLGPMFLSVGGLAMAALLCPPRPKGPRLYQWGWLARVGAISAIAAGATWVLLSRLTHPFTLVLYGTSYGYFLLRIVELLDEGPGSLCHSPGAAGFRVVFVLWLADVRTLHVVPDPARCSVWALAAPAAGAMAAAAACTALLRAPGVPPLLAVYALLGSFASGMFAVDYCYQLPVHLIWGGRLAIRPCMAAPWQAASLREFWGRRYNLTFHGLLHGYVYQPLHGRLGQDGAAFATFAVSGLLHAWPMLLAGLSVWSFASTLAFFVAHGALGAAEARGGPKPGRARTAALLCGTWPLLGAPLLRVVR